MRAHIASPFLFIALCVTLLSTSGCATARLTLAGEQVMVSHQMTRDDCQNLGPIFAKGGGSFGGAFISDEKLMEYATNDLRNKAAKKGATIVVYSTHQMGMSGGIDGGSTTTSTISGIAYRCP